MESYQKTKIPPPVPPKHHKSTSVATPVYQKENILYENGYHHPATSITGGALIQTNGMRVKIQINPKNPVSGNNCRTVLGSTSQSNGSSMKININGTSCPENQSQDMLRAAAACNNCSNNNTNVNNSNNNNNTNNNINNNNNNTINKTRNNKFIYQNHNVSNDNDYSSNAIAQSKNIIDTFGANVTKSNTSARYLNTNGNAQGYFYTNSLPSGQSSPSDNLDSGTCSDVDTGTSPPPQPQPPYFSIKKKSNAKISPLLPQHQRSGSLNSSGIGVDSEDEDNASCDSIDSSEYNGENEHTLPVISAAILKCSNNARGVTSTKRVFEETARLVACPISAGHRHPAYVANDENGQPEIGCARSCDDSLEENTDKYLHFHLNENDFGKQDASNTQAEDDSFAGFKSLVEKNSPVTTIQSSRGTVRGVKNRVRAGIATFLNNNVTKTWQDKEAGKVVVYTTTMGIIRETYHRCLKVRQILKTHLVKFEEKDVFMSREVQKEIRERMKMDEIVVPQVFVEGLHIGDAETIERLNESGELRKILKPYKSADALNTCQVCGGYRLLPCNVCNGSKKSARRPNFTELVPLKCMNCDEVGLIKCYAC